tara:strand:+ start:289 stop:564 length:276 start_codon:yes stop_codon:yes gene_type:complete
MSIELGFIEELDLLYVNSSFFFKTVSPLDKMWNKKPYIKGDKKSIVVVIENNFGSTFNERYLTLFYKSKIVYVSFNTVTCFIIDHNTFTKI